MIVRILALSATEAAWLSERLTRKSHRVDDCIVWTGQRGATGYGKVTFPRDNGRRAHTGAHRAAWLIHRGPISDPSAVLDHLCRNRDCINVEHLELVSAVENVRRGAIPNANRDRFGYLNGHARKTHCKRGHVFDEANTLRYTFPSGRTARICRSCRRLREQSRQPRILTPHASA